MSEFATMTEEQYQLKRSELRERIHKARCRSDWEECSIATEALQDFVEGYHAAKHKKEAQCSCKTTEASTSKS